jgi:hypothetical protein
MMRYIYKEPVSRSLPGGIIFSHSGHNLYNLYKDILSSIQQLTFTLTQDTEVIFDDIWQIRINRLESDYGTFDVRICYPDTRKRGKFYSIASSVPQIIINGEILTVKHRPRHNHYPHPRLRIMSYFTTAKRKIL